LTLSPPPVGTPAALRVSGVTVVPLQLRYEPVWLQATLAERPKVDSQSKLDAAVELDRREGGVEAGGVLDAELGAAGADLLLELGQVGGDAGDGELADLGVKP
jgi:hypothetical protein